MGKFSEERKATYAGKKPAGQVSGKGPTAASLAKPPAKSNDDASFSTRAPKTLAEEAAEKAPPPKDALDALNEKAAEGSAPKSAENLLAIPTGTDKASSPKAAKDASAPKTAEKAPVLIPADFTSSKKGTKASSSKATVKSRAPWNDPITTAGRAILAETADTEGGDAIDLDRQQTKALLAYARQMEEQLAKSRRANGPTDEELQSGVTTLQNAIRTGITAAMTVSF